MSFATTANIADSKILYEYALQLQRLLALLSDVAIMSMTAPFLPLNSHWHQFVETDERILSTVQTIPDVAYVPSMLAGYVTALSSSVHLTVLYPCSMLSKQSTSQIVSALRLIKPDVDVTPAPSNTPVPLR